MSAPGRPKLWNFFPFTAKARLCGGAFIWSGTHLSTDWEIRRVSDSAIVASGSNTGTETQLTVTATLVEGDTYQARIRYVNGEGTGEWSPYFKAASPVESLIGAPNDVQGEPVGTRLLPRAPDFVSSPVRQRSIHEFITQTGHVVRRPKHERQRMRSTLTWAGLTLAERDALITEIRAAIDADPPQALITDDLAHEGRSWFPRRGRYEPRLTGPGVWSLRVDVDEVLEPAFSFFTVGESEIDGAEPWQIR